MITADGRAKILDFGLAKQVPPTAATDGNSTAALSTAPGLVLGTIAYLSPKQARGVATDHRSDQFSFGCMLYEMATGKRPFDRGDSYATVAAILNDEPPPLARNNPELPPPLVWIVERCLAKDPERRYAATRDLHNAICDVRDHLAETQPVVHSNNSRTRGWSVFTLLIIAIAAVLVLLARRHDEPTQRYTPFATEAADESQPAWSPDGRTLAYVAVVNQVAQIFTRHRDAVAAAQITDSRVDCLLPFWSHDGIRVYYTSEGSLWSVLATGGVPERVLELARPSRAISSASVSPDGKTIAFFDAGGSGMSSLYVGGRGGGDAQPLKRPPFPETFRFPHGLAFSPNGSKIAAGAIRDIGPQAGFELWILPHPTGTPRQISAKLPRDVRPLGYSWMPDNRRVMLSMELAMGSGYHIYELDTENGEVHAVTSGAGEEQHPSVSRDGRTIAYANGGTDWNLAETSIEGTNLSVLLSTSRTERLHSWSPSGAQYVYVSNARGTAELWMRNEMDEHARLVATSDGAAGSLFSATPRFAPDGRRISYGRVGPKHLVWITHVAGGPAVPLDGETEDQHNSSWSPDGNWIAFCRFTNGRWEVAKAPSGGGRAIPVIAGCDSEGPIEWSPAGDGITYADSEGLHVVSPEGGNHKRLAPARPALLA